MFETSFKKYDWVNLIVAVATVPPAAPSGYLRGSLILFAAVRHLRRRDAL
jgi:hypothetical protein